MSGADGGPILLDLEHGGLPGAIGAYLLAGPEPALVDPGPARTLPRLRETLEEMGSGVGEIRHLLLTHVHLDHAGASGALTRENPRLRVHVHRDGAEHMADPSRLVASTRRTFGEAHDRLWGETDPVPEDRLRPWTPGDRSPIPGIRPIETPGHIGHHLAYLHEPSGVLFAGDSMGILLAPGTPSHPPTPPPSLDLPAWLRTLEVLGPFDPDRFAVTHFGLHDRFHERRAELAGALLKVARRVRRALDRDELDQEAQAFESEVRERISEHLEGTRVDRYFDVFTAATDFRGMAFYLERNEVDLDRLSRRAEGLEAPR